MLVVGGLITHHRPNEALKKRKAKRGDFLLNIINMKTREQMAIAALEKIAYPIKHLQEEAKKAGCKLDGNAAMQLINEAYFYQEIAKKTLNEINNNN